MRPSPRHLILVVALLSACGNNATSPSPQHQGGEDMAGVGDMSAGQDMGGGQDMGVAQDMGEVQDMGGAGDMGGMCANACSALGDRLCDGDRVRVCVETPDGCLSWSVLEVCQGGEVCSGGQCATTCQDQCAEGQTQCAGDQVQTCARAGSGCLDWAMPIACPAQGDVCRDGACEPLCVDACAAGQTQCAGAQVQTCQVGALGCTEWAAPADCPLQQACVSGGCGLSVTQDVELCGEQVFGGDVVIQGGAVISCPSGDLTIRARSILIDPASKVVLSATSTEHKGGSYNTRSPQQCYSDRGRSGAGGGGNGTAGGTATGVEYKYRVGQFGSCDCGVTPGGAGSGVRGVAHNLEVFQGGQGGEGCFYVNTYGSTICDTEDVLSGGRGGGMVRLFATDQITVMGEVLADGEDGQSAPVGQSGAPSAGSGGGAGGSVLLVAPQLNISGTISASPGAGAGGAMFSASCYSGNRNTSGADGGQGRVKLLHAGAYTNTGTILGAVETIDLMPPLDLRSATHPDPTLAYNDRFAQVELSWSAPFAGVSGYFYVLDRSATTAVTAANGTFTATPSIVLPASAFTQSGQWFVHVVSVDAQATISAVSNRFGLQINTRGPQLTSASHPDPGVWYDDPSKRTVQLSWEAPANTTDASFKGYWYRVDRDSDHTPDAAGAAGWTFTTNKQLILTQDADGQPLDAWAYYVHVIAEDQQGNLSSQASHYRVQLGAEPATMNLIGYVKDANAQAISGATVRLEPFGVEVTTDANGYFIAEDVYHGAYTATVSAPGHTTTTQTITVQPSVVPWDVVL